MYSPDAAAAMKAQSSGGDSSAAKPGLVHVVTLKVGSKRAPCVRFGSFGGKQRLIVVSRSSTRDIVSLFNIPGLCSGSQEDSSTLQQDATAAAATDDSLKFAATGLTDRVFRFSAADSALLYAAHSEQHQDAPMLDAVVIRYAFCTARHHS